MDYFKIGNFITECRKEKNLTQEELAEKLEVSSKSISRWENGTTKPDYSKLKKLCKELDINVNELLSGEKIEERDYMKKAEENFINLKKNVDKTLGVLKFIRLICIIVIIGALAVNIYFNVTNVKMYNKATIVLVTNILLYINMLFGSIATILAYKID